MTETFWIGLAFGVYIGLILLVLVDIGRSVWARHWNKKHGMRSY